MARALLVLVGCYLTSVVLAFGYLVVGAALSGKGIAAGERALFMVWGATLLTFVVGTVAVFLGIGRAVSPAARWGFSIGYCVLSCATFVVLAALGMIVFNR